MLPIKAPHALCIFVVALGLFLFKYVTSGACPEAHCPQTQASASHSEMQRELNELKEKVKRLEEEARLAPCVSRCNLSLVELTAKKLLPDVDVHGIGEQEWWYVDPKVLLDQPHRERYCRAGLKPEDPALEISPLYGPMFPQHWNVKNIDIMTKEEHEKDFKMRNDPIPPGKALTNVHYVWKGQSFRELTGGAKFKRVVHSHVIEHVADVVSFLNMIADVLEPDGEMRVLVPDYRVNHDACSSPTQLTEIIGAYVAHNFHARPESVYDSLFTNHANEVLKRNYVNRNNKLWTSPQCNPPEDEAKYPVNALKMAYESHIKYHLHGPYVGIHVWKWSPSLFALHMKLLKEMGLLKMHITHLRPTKPPHGYEFWVTFKKN